MDSPETQPSSGGWWHERGLDALAVTVSLALLAAGTWASYWALHRNDQYQLIGLGQCVYHGGRMYVDCWENKPPGIAWLNALALLASGGLQIGAWLLPTVTAGLTLILVWRVIARLLSPKAGRRTMLIGAAVFSLRLYDTPSINPDFYAAMLQLAACSLWLVAAARRHGASEEAAASEPEISNWPSATRVFLALLSGLFWAAATSVKQVGCLGLIAITVVSAGVALFSRREGRNEPRTVALTWLGFALGAGAVVAVLAAQGTLGPAWGAVFSANRGLWKWGAVGEAIMLRGRVRADLAPLALPLWLSVIGLVVTFYAGSAKDVSRRVAAAMLVWWWVEVLFALLGPSRSTRYWQATFPPMLLLAATGIYHLRNVSQRLEMQYGLAYFLLSVTAVVMFMRPMIAELQRGLLESHEATKAEPTERDQLADIGRQVQELVAPGERIYVWGYHAGVYVYADRLPASRFTYPRSQEQMNEILSDLAAGKASLLLIPKRAPEFEPWCDEECREALSRVLEVCKPDAAIGSYRVWCREAG